MELPSYRASKDWLDEPAAIVGSGSSVVDFDFDRIKGRKIVAVKDGFRVVPNADILMIGDHRYARRNPDLSEYKGPLILYTDPEPLPEELFDPRMKFIPKVAGGGLSRNRNQLRGTFTTTALAINLCVLKGCKDIVLVGVDAKPGPDGRRHFYRKDKETWPTRYQKQLWGYQRVARDLHIFRATVWNANPQSAVRCFPTWRDG